jgi:hypothetical protein
MTKKKPLTDTNHLRHAHSFAILPHRFNTNIIFTLRLWEILKHF